MLDTSSDSKGESERGRGGEEGTKSWGQRKGREG